MDKKKLARELADAKSTGRVTVQTKSSIIPDMLDSIEGRVNLSGGSAAKIVLAQLGRPLTSFNMGFVEGYLKELGIKDGSQLATMKPSEGRKLLKQIDKDLRREERLHSSVLDDVNSAPGMIIPSLGSLGTDRMPGRSYSKMDYGDALERSISGLKTLADTKGVKPEYEKDIDEVARLLSVRPLRMEKPQGTSLHHLVSWIKERPGASDSMLQMLSGHFHSFVVEHDWAAAFRGTKDFDGGEVRLPFDYVCFEFRINGLRVLVPLGTGPDGKVIGCLITGVNRNWYVNSSKVAYENGRLVDERIEDYEREDPKTAKIIKEYLTLLGGQIRAISIMLDAGVAAGREVPPSEALNKKRAKEGKTPVRSYHVVRLTKRYQAKHGQGDGTGTNKRLHWRRGHWRHYDSPSGQVKYTNDQAVLVSKTWINWMLVGDPDLGFVDKHYTL